MQKRKTQYIVVVLCMLGYFEFWADCSRGIIFDMSCTSMISGGKLFPRNILAAYPTSQFLLRHCSSCVAYSTGIVLYIFFATYFFKW